jgi:hypothetical protein
MNSNPCDVDHRQEAPVFRETFSTDQRRAIIAGQTSPA